MELDKRFKVLPFCCFGTDKRVVTNHIGKKGYFSNTISSFSDINLCKYGTLGCILDESKPEEPFYMNETNETFSFFIPECLVKPKEKSYRPYTLQEFKDKFHIGQPIRFRTKGEKVNEWCSVLVSYWNHQIGDKVITYIFIGPVQYTFDELFEDHEWWDSTTGDWKPFGVEVEE